MNNIDDVGMFMSVNKYLFIDFLKSKIGIISSNDVEKEFNIVPEVFDEYMHKRILTSQCTFYQCYGNTSFKNNYYIFSKYTKDIFPICLK